MDTMKRKDKEKFQFLTSAWFIGMYSPNLFISPVNKKLFKVFLLIEVIASGFRHYL